MHLEASKELPIGESVDKNIDGYPTIEKLPVELANPLTEYMNYYVQRITQLAENNTNINVDKRKEHADSTIANAVLRNNEMSKMLASPEYGEIRERTDALLGDCKIGVVCCIDGRLSIPLMFGTSADVSKQKAAVLPTEVSPDTGNIAIDSSTVRVAVIKAPTKQNSNLLQLFVAHGAFQEPEEPADEKLLTSNCAAVKLLIEEQLRKGVPVDSDLIRANFDFTDDAVEAVTRTYNHAAEIEGKPQLEKIAIRIVYDTESMGFVLNYGEQHPIISSDLTMKYAGIISQLGVHDARFQNPGALRYSYTDENQFINNEKTMLSIIELLMNNENFVNEINGACEEDATTELCGLNESQKQGLRYIMARNVAFQYLTGVHIENFSHKEHDERFMSIARDDGHGMVVGGMDPRLQTFSAVSSRIDNAVEHIRIMARLMEHHNSPKPYVLFISEGIEEYSAGHEGSIDSVTSRVDNIYKEIQKDQAIAQLFDAGEIIIIPVIQSSNTGRIVHIATTPLM